MAEVINMPRLSDTMEEGTVAKWLKEVGDKVEEGDILAEIETDKATMEFESFYEGTLLHIGIEEGDGAPVDSLLAIIGEEGEDISGLLNASKGGSEDKNSNSDASAEEGSEKPQADTEEAKDEGDKKAQEASGSENSDSGGGPAEIPEGVEVVKMPRLSDTMEEGTVASWLKHVGDQVEEGDILAEIETDKATMEFESFYSGTLLYIGVQEGESSPVDAVLAVIGPEGTDVDAILNAKPSSGKKEDTSSGDEREEAKSEETNQGAGLSSGSDKAGSGSNSVNEGDRIFASPLAKKMAEDKGIDLANVSGSGDNGRIVKKDIENFKTAAKAQPQEQAKAPAQETASNKAAAQGELPIRQAALPVGEESFEEVKNSQMRKTIAKRLSESKFKAPHYYLTIEVDMGNAIASRKQINEMPDVKVSFNDMVVKACAMALKKHPQVNTTWQEDTTKIQPSRSHWCGRCRRRRSGRARFEIYRTDELDPNRFLGKGFGGSSAEQEIEARRNGRQYLYGIQSGYVRYRGIHFHYQPTQFRDFIRRGHCGKTGGQKRGNSSRPYDEGYLGLRPPYGRWGHGISIPVDFTNLFGKSSNDAGII